MARKRGGRKQDHFSQEAKKRGFSARSVFKLEEIQNKDRIAGPGDRVLDLGAAPGSWTAYLAGIVGSQGAVVAVDLQPLKPARPLPSHVTEITGDFTDADIAERITELGPFDAVVSDAAPNTSGHRVLDTARSAALVETIEADLYHLLKPGGHLVVKIFQGGEEQAIQRRLQEQFRKVRRYRPKAVRQESFEAYLIGIDFQG